MAHNLLHDDDSVPTLRPRPRRPFELSASGPPSPSSTPPSEPQNFPSQLSAALASKDGNSTPARNRSILNLTSSTLFGIYSPTGYAVEREEPSTPWGTGAETPVDSDKANFEIPDTILANGPNGLRRRRRSTAVAQRHIPLRVKRGLKGYWLPLLGRVIALFGVGVLYGMLVSHLHDRQEIAPVKVEGIDRTAWPYYVFWGSAGVLLGQALPHLDAVWNGDEDEDIEEREEDARRRRSTGSRQQGMVAWNDVVRSVGAFVGIAFAIRKLPWQSTLQLSLTLALANPAIWFLVDRSPPGFILSTLVSIGGTGMLLGVNPALLPSPSPRNVLHHHAGNATAQLTGTDELVLGLFSNESVGVATWIASVLFVSCVCFGNIGRKLAPRRA
ncbi:hypothetical protein Q7P37_002959 [Cladosporium fusiforme]